VITLTFSRAIPVFFSIQTLLFLLLLMASEKKISANTKPIISERNGSIILLFLYTMLIIGNILMVLDKISYSVQTIIIIIVPAIIVPLLTIGFNTKPLFAVTVLWHMFLLSFAMPPDLLSITEGVHMTRTMIIYGRWIPELAHNPSYNPFPTMAFLRAALSYATGIPWFSWFLAYIILIIVTLAFDLAVYSLTLRMTTSYSAAILAVIIAALTPYLVVTGHAYQVPATIMWLLSITIFMKTLRNTKRIDLIPITLLYITAILTHATAYVVMVFPLLLVLLMYVFEGKGKSFKVNSILVLIILIFFIFGIVRTVYEELYAKYLYTLGYGGITELTNKLLALFIEEDTGVFKFSLYDYGGLPFYQASLWALTASLASAIVIYSILRKRTDIIMLALFISGALFIGLGYLFGTLIIVSTQLYRGAYVAFSFLIPLAAETIRKIIDSRKRFLVLIVMFILILNSFLAISDPEISSLYGLKARGIPEKVLDMMATQNDIVKANIIVDLANNIGVLNDFMFYSKYSLWFERLTTYGKHIATFYSRFNNALYKILYIRGYTKGDTPIVDVDVADPSKLSTSIANYSIVINFGDDLVFKL
jgi:hypothetical protein